MSMNITTDLSIEYFWQRRCGRISVAAVADLDINLIVSLFDWHSIVIWFVIRLIGSTANVMTFIRATTSTTTATTTVQRSQFQSI